MGRARETKRPLVSVLVLNYNGQSHLADCLGSLALQVYEPLEVVVADNGSTDGSHEVADQYPVRWEGFGSNLGFAPGLNAGVTRCKGEIIVFVNNDMRFADRFVE